MATLRPLEKGATAYRISTTADHFYSYPLCWKQRRKFGLKRQASFVASENSVLLLRESLDRPSARSVVRYFVAANKSKSKAPPAEGGQRRSGRFPILVPSESFWGLTFRLKRTTAELKKLDEVIRSGDIDPRVLREFRDAVDYVRKTAWAVQEWQERQFQHRETATVRPLLMAERIRRAAHICTAVSSDLKNHDIAPETACLEALFQATLRLYLDLAVLFGNDPVP